MPNPLSVDVLKSAFERGLTYDRYLAAAKPHEQQNWATFSSHVVLTPGHRTLIAGFIRNMKVICLSGSWCGDCVQQVPFIDHVQRANPGRIEARYLERESNMELSDQLKICSGNRVPVTIFMNEDYEFVSLFGDRSLNRYRAIAERQLGVACPLPGAPVPADQIAAQLQDWIDEFERVHLLLRLSGKLRHRHGD